jgi:hypothetical protein
LLSSIDLDQQTSAQHDISVKWDILDPIYAYDHLAIALDYEVNDFVDDSMATYSLWDTDCKGGGVGVEGTGLTGSLVGDGTPPGVGLGNRNIRVNVQIHSPEVELTPIFETNNDQGEERIATVRFCVRFGLKTPGEYSVEVNFLETLIDIRVDFTDGFSIGDITVATEAIVNQTRIQDYQLHTYFCASSAETESNEQGTVYKICIEPTAEAIGDGVRMKSILWFTFILLDENGDQTSVIQKAVVDGAEASNGLTRLICEQGAIQCSIETILVADFYAGNGTVDGFGVATMQFGTLASGRRLGRGPLSSSSSERDLQTDEDDGSSQEISVQFKVGGTPPPLSYSWWFGGPDGPGVTLVDIAIYVLFIFCVLSLTLLFMQQPRFQGSPLYL